MHALLALAIGSAMLGTDVGWQPAEDGGLEYIIQIEPETLARLKTGDQLSAAIRPVLQDVRRYRVVIGTGPLPHIALPDSPATQPAQPVTPALPRRGSSWKRSRKSIPSNLAIDSPKCRRLAEAGPSRQAKNRKSQTHSSLPRPTRPALCGTNWQGIATKPVRHDTMRCPRWR
ncbi:MAG: hypothetical protein K8T25_13585 [Planctomycetia bacterium]|nr:hypothetical protein [Planctomycetia bacterium]